LIDAEIDTVIDTVVVRVDPEHPEPEAIARAAALLRAGRLVAFPTETVYGLGADALDAAAAARIFVVKGRPSTNPLIVHVADTGAAKALVAEWPHNAELLAARFWPGALTLVLPRRPEVPDVVTAGGPTVALRVPAHPIALALLRAAGPIAAPSANRSTTISPTMAAHVLTGLRGRIPMVLDGGACTGGLESTVLDLTTTPPRLLRPGLISPDEIERAIGPIQRHSGNDPGAVSRSPGQMARHYAPRATLLFGTRQDAVRLADGGKPVGWLGFGDREPPGTRITSLAMPSEPGAYAHMLYAALHALDAAGVAWIVVETPPDTDDWLAVWDRLQRAAKPAATAHEQERR
jgi:L-threonylcarbamoyladenylate synthase